MGGYIFQRIIQAVIVVAMVSMLVFTVMHLLPGDPVMVLSGTSIQGLTPEQEAKMRHDLWLDRPLYVQYGHWVWNLLHGDWGTSVRNQVPVFRELQTRLPVTLQLAIYGWLIAIIIGLTAGVISATRSNTKLDTAATLVSMFGIAMPNFWLGILLIYLFSMVLGWFPTAGFVSFSEAPLRSLHHMILPAFALGFVESAVIMRQTRSGILEVLRQDYVRVARAKGLSERTITWIHALKNAALPILTIMGLQLGRLIGGTVIIEAIFGLPGLGSLAVQSIFMRDYLPLQGVVLLVTLGVAVINLLTDMVYAYIDPRIRYGKQNQ